jgi:hypothetical protein
MEVYECVGGPLDGKRVRKVVAESGIFSKTETTPTGENVKHWYALLSRVDTVHQQCVMFFSYRGTDRKQIWEFPIVAPPFEQDTV